MAVSQLGLILGVLVVCEDGLNLCTDTPEAVREGDFVVVRGERVVPTDTVIAGADYLEQGQRAQGLLSEKGRYLAEIERLRDRRCNP